MRHSLRVERDGAVGHVVLLGPGQGNAMGPARPGASYRPQPPADGLQYVAAWNAAFLQSDDFARAAAAFRRPAATDKN